MRIEVDDEGLAAKLRLAAYLQADHFLSVWRTLADTLGPDPAMVLIVLTINSASIQRALRGAGDDAAPPHGQAIEAHHFKPISRRAIAQATGLSRETVRRKVRKLIEAGVVVEDGQGVKSMNVMADPRAAQAVLQMSRDQVRLANRLLAEGVLRPRPDAV